MVLSSGVRRWLARTSALVLVGSVVPLVAGLAPGIASAQVPPWTVVASPNPTVGASSSLSDVSCVGPSWCMAAGFNDGGDLIEQWNGTAWSVDSIPAISTGTGLSGVSCASTSFCAAVGSSGVGSGNVLTTIDMWDGISWSTVPSPDPGTDSNYLFGVSCVSDAWCMADGLSQNLSDPQDESTLIEEWDGTSWSVVSSANPVSDGANVLQDLTCLSTAFCMAVGNTSDNSGNDTLAETWDGSGWSVVSTPNPGPLADLSGVSCSSESQCFATGYAHENGAQSSVIEQWGGTSWTVVTSPDEGTNNGLGSVSCPQVNDCLAVGSNSTTGSFIVLWDGSTWSVVPPPANAGGLGRVTCVGTTDQCVGVGGVVDNNDVVSTLVESNYQSAAIATGVTVTSSLNPSVVGQSVTFTATVSPTDGTGSVTFYSDQLNTPISAACADVPLTSVGGAHQAQCTTSDLAAGRHTIVATYTGSGSYDASSGSLSGKQDVQLADQLTLTSSANPSSFGQPVIFTATISSTDGHGTVAFYADGSTTALTGCGTVELEQPVSPWVAECRDSSLSGGTHSIEAVYTGDTAYESSSGTLSGGQTITGDPTSMTAAPAVLEVSPLGLPLFTLKATLNSGGDGLDGQTVVFTAGSTTLCSTTTTGDGDASCDVLKNPAGLLALLEADGYTVSFDGTADYLPSQAKAPLIG